MCNRRVWVRAGQKQRDGTPYSVETGTARLRRPRLPEAAMDWKGSDQVQDLQQQARLHHPWMLQRALQTRVVLLPRVQARTLGPPQGFQRVFRGREQRAAPQEAEDGLNKDNEIRHDQDSRTNQPTIDERDRAIAATATRQGALAESENVRESARPNLLIKNELAFSKRKQAGGRRSRCSCSTAGWGACRESASCLQARHPGWRRLRSVRQGSPADPEPARARVR